jgi:ribosomal protein S18 acetylase RimI-like enzyme
VIEARTEPRDEATPPSPAPAIGKMDAHHLDACARIVGELELFRAYDFTPAVARRLLGRALEEGRSDLVVALQGEDVAGFAWFVPRAGFDRSGYLRLIAVDPAQKGGGLGQRLLGHLEQAHLKDGGILLLASAHNTSAHRFYERMGYRPVGELPDYVRPGTSEKIFFKPPPPR